MKFETPFGPAWACIDGDGSVTAFGFGESDRETGCSAELEQQIREYFDGRRQRFDLPLRPKGTPFQKQVWSELQQIPYGTTITYTELARRAGRGNAPRAAGRANATNPLAVIIPCHRVVGSKGELTGYAFGIETKKKLLEFEQRIRAASLREASRATS